MEISLKRQQGMGWFGLTLVFAAIAFVALVVIKVGPLYSNHFVLVKAVKAVADTAELANADPGRIRSALERRWDVDYIDQIDDKDIKIKRSNKGRVLAYDYEARVNLFYNIYVVVHFVGEHPMRKSLGGANDS
ncbi:MAG: DUF4845 domain-containing protein [Panacagrimonas sp.]